QRRRRQISGYRDSRADERTQWLNISGGGEQLGWHGNKRRSNVNRKHGCGGTDDYDATCQPDGDCRTDGELRSSGEWDCTAELSVAEEWRQHQRGDLSESERYND